MKIAIIAALSREVNYYIETIDHLEEKTIADKTYWLGSYQDKDLVIAQSGVGKVNAALATTVVALEDPDVIINTGSAGAIDPSLKIGDIVLAEYAIYNDVDATAFDNVLGQVDGMPVNYPTDPQWRSAFYQYYSEHASQANIKVGPIVSGDSFIASQDKVAWIQEHFPGAMCTEMEGTAIGQVAYRFKIPFVIIRAISDTANHDANITFEEFIEKVGRQSAQATLDFIAKLQ